MDAQLDEVGGESGFRRADAKIRRERKTQAAADGRPLHGADHRLSGAKQADALPVHQTGEVLEAGLGELRGAGLLPLAGAEIGAGAERFAVRGKQDDAAGRIFIQGLVGVRQLGDQAAVEEIVRRPVDLHRGDPVRQAEVDVGKFAGHGVAP